MKLRMFIFIYIKKWIVLQIFTVLSVSCCLKSAALSKVTYKEVSAELGH